MKWKEWVTGIDRVFVEIWACTQYALWKRGKPIGKDKHIKTKEEALESIAQFIKKHSDDDHNINECREQAQLIWEKIEKEGKVL